MEYAVGQVVYSKCGHDKGKAFIVTAVEDEYLWIVDGKSRTVDKPKRKKTKHVQVTGFLVDEIKNKIENEEYILNADFIKAIKKFGDKSRAQ
jgi:ribosomal protein L14E/L6E/L27E